MFGLNRKYSFRWMFTKGFLALTPLSAIGIGLADLCLWAARKRQYASYATSCVSSGHTFGKEFASFQLLSCVFLYGLQPKRLLR